MSDRLLSSSLLSAGFILLASCAPEGNVDEESEAGGPRSAMTCGVPARRLVSELGVPTPGVTYFVGPAGNDGNDGRSADRAFQTGQRANSAVHPGDTVLFLTGNYAPFGITTSGAPGAWIAYRAAAGARPHIDYSSWCGISVQADYVAIAGFDIKGALGQLTDADKQKATDLTHCASDAKINGSGICFGSCAGGQPGHHHLLARRNTVYDGTESGITACNTDYVTIEDNDVFRNAFYSCYAGSGISMGFNFISDQTTVTKNFIQFNVSHDNQELVPIHVGTPRITDGNGIIIDTNNSRGAYNGRTRVSNNLVYGNGGSGIHAYHSDNVDIVSNTAYKNNQVIASGGQIFSAVGHGNHVMNNILWAADGKPVVSNAGNTNTSYTYNLYWNSSTDPAQAFGGQLPPHSLVADPRFANPACLDFRLQSGSPAIDSGTRDWTPPVDLAGTSRPGGGAYDRGAYERP